MSVRQSDYPWMTVTRPHGSTGRHPSREAAMNRATNLREEYRRWDGSESVDWLPPATGVAVYVNRGDGMDLVEEIDFVDRMVAPDIPRLHRTIAFLRSELEERPAPLTWSTHTVPPGQLDDVGEEVPAGVYVTARADELEDGPRVALYVAYAVDGEGYVRATEVGQHLVALLNGGAGIGAVLGKGAAL